MLVEVRIDIQGSREAVWAVVADVTRAADLVRGIDRIDILERPAAGLVGLRWRETRMLFGKPATAEKWITEAVEPQHYRTRAEDGGFLFLTTLALEEGAGCTTLTSTHLSLPTTFAAKLMAIPMGLLFKGVARRALQQDLEDYKAAVEAGGTAPPGAR